MGNSILKKDVINIITKEKKSTFLNHFLTFINRNTSIVGEIKSNEILLWKTNMWISGGFPIFIFEFDDNYELINITTERNKFAKYSNFILFIPIISLIAFTLLRIDFSFASLIFPLFFVFVLIALFFITNHIYNYEKKQLHLEIFNILNIEFDEEKIKEFTLSKLLTRLIIYPLSIILIICCLFIIPNSPILGLIGLVLSSTYIVSDILILLKRKKDKDQI